MKTQKILNEPMKFAIQILRKRWNKIDVPVACVIVNNKKELISFACNETIKRKDPLAHAELIAIKKASLKLKSNYLNNLSLYVTLEPCAMCEAAIIQSGIKKVFFGAYSDSVSKLSNRRRNFLEKSKFQFYGGFREHECSEMLSNFFKKLRKTKKII